MWHALVWIPLLVLMSLWSLLCWGLHALLTGPDWSAGGSADWLAWLERWQIPLWLTEWLPMAAVTEFKAWLTTMGPWLESLLAQAPALLGWLSPLVWLGWGMGLAVLAVVGLVGSVLIAALKRDGTGGPPRQAAGRR